MKQKLLSCIWLFATPWTIWSMEFSRPEYWSGTFPSPRDLPNPGIEPRSPALQAESWSAEPSGNTLQITKVLILKCIIHEFWLIYIYIYWYIYNNIYKIYIEVKLLSHVWLFATPWTVAYQALPSMGFSRQECWSGLPFASPEDLPDPGIKPGTPAL